MDEFLRYFLKEITVIHRSVCRGQISTPTSISRIKVPQLAALRAIALYPANRNSTCTCINYGEQVIV